VSNKAERWWTRTQRIRTAAQRPFEAVLADASAAPAYQRLAAKALQLQQLGLGPLAIARRMRIDRKTVIKSLAWLARREA
jgi:hypothetical protein